MTKAEKAHILRTKASPCIVSGSPPPSAAHHTDTGMGRKKDHFKVIPLTYDLHQGREGIHFLGKKRWEAKYGTEEQHLQRHLANLGIHGGQDLRCSDSQDEG